MDAKKTVRKFIIPNYWILIVGAAGFLLGLILIGIGGEAMYSIAFAIMMLTVIPLFIGLFGILPGIFGTTRTLKHLRKTGKLDAAATELSGEPVNLLCRKRVACTEHFLFVRRGSYVCAYEDILWVHKQKFTTRFLMIPIYTRESVVVYTHTRSYNINLGCKDKNNELTPLITEICRHNSKVLVGFTKENQNAYKQLIKSK